MQIKRNVIAGVFPVMLAAALNPNSLGVAQSIPSHFMRIGLGAHGSPRSATAAATATTQGYLGIGFRDVSEDRLPALKLKEVRGAEIIHVDHDGPASEAGLREHDVILQLNGLVIEGEEQLRRVLRETPVGRSVSMLVSRDGLQITVSTQMADRSTVEREAWQQHIKPDAPSPMRGNGFLGGLPLAMPPITAPPDPKTHSFLNTGTLGSSFTGAALEMIGPQLAQFFGSQGGNGLLVRSVEPNSPAATAGMRAGDVVVRANAVVLAGTTDWVRLIHENKGRPLSVVVVRDKQEQTLVLVPDSKKRSSVDLQSFPVPDDPSLVRDQARAISRPIGEID